MIEIERKKIMIECDMLEGNINRMMITNNETELEQMYVVAINRINKLYDYNLNRIKNK